MAKSKTDCRRSKKPRSRPKLRGRKARFSCNRCGMAARKKKEVCKPRSE